MGSGASTARPVVVLLSGGLDSATVLALATRDGYVVHALSFRYGQRHAHELAAARTLADRFGVVHHQVVDIDLRAFGASALTSDALEVPRRHDVTGTATIPVTYVPARNTIFLSFALALAEVTGGRDIFIGVNALDYSGYPDCRPGYIAAFEHLANLATRAGVEATRDTTPWFRIRAPLIDMTKREIISLGISLGVDYAMTTSCYDPAPDGAACGHCDACQLRLAGFAAAGMNDPIRYAGTVPIPAATPGGRPACTP